MKNFPASFFICFSICCFLAAGIQIQSARHSLRLGNIVCDSTTSQTRFEGHSVSLKNGSAHGAKLELFGGSDAFSHTLATDSEGTLRVSSTSGQNSVSISQNGAVNIPSLQLGSEQHSWSVDHFEGHKLRIKSPAGVRGNLTIESGEGEDLNVYLKGELVINPSAKVVGESVIEGGQMVFFANPSYVLANPHAPAFIVVDSYKNSFRIFPVIQEQATYVESTVDFFQHPESRGHFQVRIFGQLIIIETEPQYGEPLCITGTGLVVKCKTGRRDSQRNSSVPRTGSMADRLEETRENGRRQQEMIQQLKQANTALEERVARLETLVKNLAR